MFIHIIDNLNRKQLPRKEDEKEGIVKSKGREGYKK